MPSLPATVPQRLRHLLLNVLAFALCYPSANLLARQAASVRHLALPWETAIPFLPWMILPYMSSGLWFCLVFFMVRSQNQLRILSQRLLLATVLASLVFVFFPLQFSWPRPAMQAGAWSALYDVLAWMDQPYNQLPSLHVAYCILFWQTLRLQLPPHGVGRILLAGALSLTAISTLFTYQHHLLDVAGGILLALFCMRTIVIDAKEAQVSFYYLMLAGILLVLGQPGIADIAGLPHWLSWLAIYLVCSLLLVALAYWRRDRYFLRKTAGRHPWWIWLLYAPYLSGYRLTWLAVVWRERRKPVVLRLTPQLWVGRRLGRHETSHLPAGCSIIDLANELSETASLRQLSYWHCPLQDLVAPPPEAIQAILQHLRQEIADGKIVYLHCAMGYSRCILLAKLFMSQANPPKQ